MMDKQCDAGAIAGSVTSCGTVAWLRRARLNGGLSCGAVVDNEQGDDSRRSQRPLHRRTKVQQPCPHDVDA